MATTPATGNGPFEFTDAQGRHWSIPLSAIQFSGNQYVVDPHWSALTGAQPASSFLQYAVAEGIIAPAPPLPPFAAMVIQAATPGAAGNNIKVQVVVSNAVGSPPTDDPTQTLFSLTVTESDTYHGLTTATIKNVLNSQSGLVQVGYGPTENQPPESKSAVGFSGSPPQIIVHSSASPAVVLFTLVPKTGADSTRTQVTISPDISSPPVAGQQTFSLTATWQKTVPGLTVLTLDAMVKAQLGYEIKVSRPSVGAYSVPAPVTAQLSGGAPGVNASATLFTGR